MGNFLLALWGVISRLLHFIGRILTILLLTVVYVAAFIPLGLLLQVLHRTPLAPAHLQGSTWHQRPLEDHSLEGARRPY